MRVTWSLPMRGERLGSSRGDLVRARSLIEALRASGHDVRVVEADAAWSNAAATSVYRRLVRRVLPAPAALVLRDLGRVLHARKHARRVAAAALEQQADLIVETQVHFSDSGSRAARVAGVPLLLDDCSPLSEEVVLGAGLPALGARMLRQQASAAAAVVVSSPQLARLLTGELRGRKPRVVSNGVDLDAYLAADRLAARRRIGAREGECIAVFVGSFQHWHGTALLPAALTRLSRNLAFRILLVGEGPAREPTLSLATRLGVSDRLICWGAVSAREIPLLLAGCDLGVLPGSNDYGQPMKLLEYAAAALPIVAPDLPPVRDLVVRGESGLLFAPGNASDLADRLEVLARDRELRRAIGRAARANLASGSDWRERARQLLAGIPAPGTPARDQAAAAVRQA